MTAGIKCRENREIPSEFAKPRGRVSNEEDCVREIESCYKQERASGRERKRKMESERARTRERESESHKNQQLLLRMVLILSAAKYEFNSINQYVQYPMSRASNAI